MLGGVPQGLGQQEAGQVGGSPSKLGMHGAGHPDGGQEAQGRQPHGWGAQCQHGRASTRHPTASTPGGQGPREGGCPPTTHLLSLGAFLSLQGGSREKQALEANVTETKGHLQPGKSCWGLPSQE